jgi:tRNA pseudouridine38-40 synthase
MRLKLVLAYDGAPFAGWQSQTSGDAVQDVVARALEKIAGTRVTLHGAGRTDAGVHALGQCAHAEVEGSMKPAEWQRALNANLPPAIRIVRAQEAAADFHARFSAKGKIYRYTLRNGPILPPHEVGRVWHFPQKLDFEVFARAARIFEGRHDFAAFAANRGTVVKDTRRTIRRVSPVKKGELWSVTFEGEGFLYKMVRMLMAAAVRAGQDREPIEGLEARLKVGSPKWNHVAPADGLTLVRVLY